MCLHVVTLGNWLSLIVALMQDVSSSLFESSTDRTAYHKKQLNVFKNHWTGFGTAGPIGFLYGLMVQPHGCTMQER